MGTLTIKDIKLEDDETSTGGKSYVDETLTDFIAGCECEDYKLTTINQELKACGLKPITLDQIDIVAIDAEDYD